MTADTVINRKQGIPKNANVSIFKLPGTVFVIIYMVMKAANCPIVCIKEA
jgi:hypothetical protein